jgi:hypothetical protein
MLKQKESKPAFVWEQFVETHEAHVREHLAVLKPILEWTKGNGPAPFASSGPISDEEIARVITRTLGKTPASITRYAVVDVPPDGLNYQVDFPNYSYARLETPKETLGMQIFLVGVAAAAILRLLEFRHEGEGLQMMDTELFKDAMAWYYDGAVFGRKDLTDHLLPLMELYQKVWVVGENTEKPDDWIVFTA